jgi:hypothetical protein
MQARVKCFVTDPTAFVLVLEATSCQVGDPPDFSKGALLQIENSAPQNVEAQGNSH